MGLHRIRLSTPWESSCQSAAAAKTGSVSSTRKLPLTLSDLLAKESTSGSETVSLSRKFHRPTGIDDATRVLIEISLENIAVAEVLKAVVLNRESLLFSNQVGDEGSLLCVDVSGRLLPFNLLELQFSISATHTSGRLLSVTLMIEE